MNRYLIVAIIVFFALTPQTNSAAIFEATPDKLICSFKTRPGRPAGRVVLYIDTKFADGTVWYRSLGDAPRVVVLDADGNFKSSTTLFHLKDCEKL
jgi:hypothetical protein